MSVRVVIGTGTALVLLACGTACGGGGSSSSGAALPTPSDPTRSGASTTVSQPHGLVGSCHLVSPRVLHAPIDRSRAVPCSHRHNLETVAVHPVYTKLTPANIRATVNGYCSGPDYGNYLNLDEGALVRLWGVPHAMRRPDGSWVVRCDAYVQTRVGDDGPAAVIRTSLRAQARSGSTAAWIICTGTRPRPGVPMVDCRRPHAFEVVRTFQTVTAIKDVYPTPAQLRTRGTAVCRHAIAHRPDAAQLVVVGSWTSRHDWVAGGSRTDIYGSCYFFRRDQRALPAEH